MKDLNVYRFHVPFDDEGTFQLKREFPSDISAFAFAAVRGAVLVEKFNDLNAKWEQVTNFEIDAKTASNTLAEWFDMRKYIDVTMLDAIAAGILVLKGVQLRDA